MKAQTWIFLILIAIVGFIFYQMNNEQEEGIDPLKNRPVTEMIEENIAEPEDNNLNDTEGVKEASEDTMEKDQETEEIVEETTREDGQDPLGPVIHNIEGQTFTSYTNRAVGYTIQRPDNWYWQHFFVTELTAHETIDDILAISRAPLPDITDIYDAAIIIDVSQEKVLPSGSGQNVTIGDTDAVRYESATSIHYLFDLPNGKTVRCIYSFTEEDKKEKTIFEHMVHSISF